MLGLISGTEEPPSGSPPVQRDMVDRIGDLVARHPLSATGTGLVLGTLISACQEELLGIASRQLKDLSERLPERISTLVHEAMTRSLSGVASEVARMMVARR